MPLNDNAPAGQRPNVRRAGRPWTPAEDNAVRVLSPVAAAARIGRSVGAVYARRFILGTTLLPKGSQRSA